MEQKKIYVYQIFLSHGDSELFHFGTEYFPDREVLKERLKYIPSSDLSLLTDFIDSFKILEILDEPTSFTLPSLRGKFKSRLKVYVTVRDGSYYRPFDCMDPEYKDLLRSMSSGISTKTGRYAVLQAGLRPYVFDRRRLKYNILHMYSGLNGAYIGATNQISDIGIYKVIDKEKVHHGVFYRTKPIPPSPKVIMSLDGKEVGIFNIRYYAEEVLGISERLLRYIISGERSPCITEQGIIKPLFGA